MKTTNTSILILVVYVDDIFVIRSAKVSIQVTKTYLQ